MLFSKIISLITTFYFGLIIKSESKDLSQKELFSRAFKEASKDIAKEMGYKIEQN